MLKSSTVNKATFLYFIASAVLLLSFPGDIHAKDKGGGKNIIGWQSLVDSTLKSGKDKRIRENISSLLGLKGRWDSKWKRVNEAEASDGLHHLVYLMVAKSAKTKKHQPKHFIFLAIDWNNRWADSYFYAAALDGRLKKAIRIRGKNTKTGKPVRGSGKVKRYNIKRRSVKKRFNHEVDFWLKGKYRRKTKPAQKTK